MIFESLDFSANRVEGDDLLGDASEYLMRHFATDSGKSKGQFYTPAEVFTWGGTTISFLARPWQSKSIHQIGTTAKLGNGTSTGNYSFMGPFGAPAFGDRRACVRKANRKLRGAQQAQSRKLRSRHRRKC